MLQKRTDICLVKRQRWVDTAWSENSSNKRIKRQQRCKQAESIIAAQALSLYEVPLADGVQDLNVKHVQDCASVKGRVFKHNTDISTSTNKCSKFMKTTVEEASENRWKITAQCRLQTHSDIYIYTNIYYNYSSIILEGYANLARKAGVLGSGSDLCHQLKTKSHVASLFAENSHALFHESACRHKRLWDDGFTVLRISPTMAACVDYCDF